jgi:hypothetical protein
VGNLRKGRVVQLRYSRVNPTSYDMSLFRCSRQARVLSVSSTKSTFSKSSWPRPLLKPEAGVERVASARVERGAAAASEAGAKEAWSATPPNIAASLSRAFVQPAVSFASAVPFATFATFASAVPFATFASAVPFATFASAVPFATFASAVPFATFASAIPFATFASAIPFASASCSSFGEYTGLSTEGGIPNEVVGVKIWSR